MLWLSFQGVWTVLRSIFVCIWHARLVNLFFTDGMVDLVYILAFLPSSLSPRFRKRILKRKRDRQIHQGVTLDSLGSMMLR